MQLVEARRSHLQRDALIEDIVHIVLERKLGNSFQTGCIKYIDGAAMVLHINGSLVADAG